MKRKWEDEEVEELRENQFLGVKRTRK